MEGTLDNITVNANGGAQTQGKLSSDDQVFHSALCPIHFR